MMVKVSRTVANADKSGTFVVLPPVWSREYVLKADIRSKTRLMGNDPD